VPTTSGHYVPSNMTLVVVGAVDPALVRTRRPPGIRKTRRGICSERAALPTTARRSGRIDAQSIEPFRKRQAYLGLGWRAPRLGDQDSTAVGPSVAHPGRLTQRHD